MTKVEPRSDAAHKILDLTGISKTSSVTGKLRSYILNEIVSNRDMGKEEGARILLGLKGKECSHSF